MIDDADRLLTSDETIAFSPHAPSQCVQGGLQAQSISEPPQVQPFLTEQ
jgi:hypothetical protein